MKSPYYDENGLKKGAWSPEEDDKLKVYVQRYGHWNWRELPKFAGNELNFICFLPIFISKLNDSYIKVS